MKAIPKQLSPSDLNHWLQKPNQHPLLIDVREENELKIAPFPFPVIHLPLSQSSDWIENLPELMPKAKNIVVLCHAGVRSWQFGSWLINQDWGYEVWNLNGGIDAWSSSVDPSVPRY